MLTVEPIPVNEWLLKYATFSRYQSKQTPVDGVVKEFSVELVQNVGGVELLDADYFLKRDLQDSIDFAGLDSATVTMKMVTDDDVMTLELDGYPLMKFLVSDFWSVENGFPLQIFMGPMGELVIQHDEEWLPSVTIVAVDDESFLLIADLNAQEDMSFITFNKFEILS